MIANSYLKIIAKAVDNLKNKSGFEKGKDNVETLFLSLRNKLSPDYSKTKDKKEYIANIAKDFSNSTKIYAVELSLSTKDTDNPIKTTLFVDNGNPLFQIKESDISFGDDFKRNMFLLSIVAYAKAIDDEFSTFYKLMEDLIDTGVKTGYTPTNFEITSYKDVDNLSLFAKIENGKVNTDIQDIELELLNVNRFGIKSIDKNFSSQDWKILDDSNHVYNQFEEERLRNNPLTEGYVPTLDDKFFVQRLVNSIRKRGVAPSFFFYGPAGTGKSEKGKYFSKMTGLPYTFICCSAMTTESDLRGKPQTLGTTGGLVKFFQKAVKSFWNRNIDIDGLDDDKIKYSLTELVLACKYGWIIEIQEPTLITNAGTLGFLNCILDNNRTLILPDGEQIKIHPNTTFIFTTNLTYEGCNLLNNSLLSRIDYVKKIELPSTSEQVNRLASITKYQGNRKDLEKVIQSIGEISIILNDNGITQGIADFRSAVDCVLDYMENDNSSWRLSAQYTIEDKACLEEGYAEIIKNKLDSIFGEY